ncbi:MAG: DegT/DnrJ/EryC1/StrS family aminotransferase [Ignavibacteriales bacterium]|nr:DegT/DnrJ/EryC1/StrS family aminotransferase [Ignavibacteriales bacterium]MCF8315115.1 DegT/DnrJ/EryC1/StrS family aminotransferase [Ignavibacteriales bacterium]MCF8435889.1 DegT/DnrJ/EryC1/StrS family aminotransferase [Ignavibacteriales bacterium]
MSHHNTKKRITVTQPSLPPIQEFIPYLEKIWENKWLTNNGPFHQELEKKLAEFLGVKYISLFANGTLALITALQQLRITGEVITTPFSFVATAHSLWWNNIQPIFVDIEPKYLNIDPEKIESAITPHTTAIMPVHVYGNPCNVTRIQEIAQKHNLKVIYDSAHAFGVKLDGGSILNYGDLSVLSFHATKVYNTFEGGAIICHDEKTKQQIDNLKNFGFVDEITVVAPGINSKMNEIQAAFGLLQLNYLKANIAKRKIITESYQNGLKNINGISFLKDIPAVTHNYSYFPILVNTDEYGMSRDQLYFKLKSEEIYSRRYFYPLISNLPTYRSLLSSAKENLPVANEIAEKVICLPIFDSLDSEDVSKVIQYIQHFSRS